MVLMAVSLIDFKKAIDSVDRETLDGIIREFGINIKLANTTKETLTGTTSNLKFMCELSRPFEIQTGVRQGTDCHRYYSIAFYLEKNSI